MKKILFFLIISLSSSIYASEIPKYEEYIVHSEVNLAASWIYNYNYILINPNTNKNFLRHLDIYIPKNPNGKKLQWENLSYGKSYFQYSSESKKDKVVPVGLDGPEGWSYGLGEDENGKGFAGFGSMDGYEILPGYSLRGLILMSYGLPGLKDAELIPAIDYDNLSEEYWENVELTSQLKESLVHRTKTVGPTAPPAEFDPIAFIDYILSLRVESSSLGWITNKGIEQSLDRKLQNAKKDLLKGNEKSAINTLEALVNDVEAQGCPTYDDCSPGKHLTSEAYALLKYNTEYLIGQLNK
jgi:hypothetical protein